MKKLFLSIFAALSLIAPVFAEEFKSSNGVFVVDFQSGWKPGKSDDPTVMLKLEKGKSFVDFAKLDDTLNDRYLEMRVKEQVESLRGKGVSLSGDVRLISLHGVSNAKYTTYASGETDVYIAFFTYNEASFAVSASGLSESEFRSAIATIRKPGEELPKPPKPKKIRVVKKKVEEPPLGVEISSEGVTFSSSAVASSTAAVSTEAVVMTPQSGEANPMMFQPAPISTGPTAGEQAAQAIGDFFTRMEQRNATKPPAFIQRRPLNFFIWLALIALWVGGAFWARGEAAKFQNPKLPPPPKDVPPDFFFPFLISKISTVKESTYNIQNRQRQLLLASFNFEHEIYIVGAVYGLLAFHVFWSLMEFMGRGGRVTGLLFAVPGGRLWASVPEIFFLIPLVTGVFMYINKKQILQLFDSQSNLLMVAQKELVYCMIRDGKGKEVARLVAKAGAKERAWDFVDTDNQVVYTIKDDFPRGYMLRKIFGSLGCALRSRYSIFVDDRRAGFVFLDPNSPGKSQIHLDFAFARLANAAQILASVLYIISKEKDPLYPSPF